MLENCDTVIEMLQNEMEIFLSFYILSLFYGIMKLKKMSDHFA